MATEVDPSARDRRSTFDYRGGDEDVPSTLAPLASLVDGDVRFDEYSRQLYATDASIFEVTPLCVVFPAHGRDVERVLAHCDEHDVPVLPRGGGTSLAGQAVNEAVVFDFTRYMNRLVDVDPAGRTATVEPGIVLADLNVALADDGLKFAPDPAWGDKSTVGGAIGNNSTGAHSLEYEKTDAYIEEVEVVLADGTTATFGECTLEEIAARADPDGDVEARYYAFVDELVTEHGSLIEDAYPDLHRNVSGYNLDRIVDEAASGSINVARLLAGSEGTLAVVTEATIALEPVPETAGVGLFVYPTLVDAMADVPAMLEHDPSAVEVIDDVLLSLARDTEEFGELARSLPSEAEAVLLVECYAADRDEARRRISTIVADRTPDDITPSGAPDSLPTDPAPVRATAAREAYDAAERDRFWKLRKSGLPILLGRTTDEKHIAFIEDTAVPADALADYVADVQAILEDHGTFASFYAHAGPGCLHIRPLVNTKNPTGLADMESIADAVTDVVVEYGGSIAGEHGDGRARTQWNRKQYGDEVMALFGEIKAAVDPNGLLNPGQVCGDVQLTEQLRFDPDYDFEAPFEPSLNWENDNGFQGMVELCHGCGGCRGNQDTTGGVMCPTYRASREEITATRGRANMLRQAMSGDLPPDEVTSEEFLSEVLDLCIGCKGCARDCPSEVDMAKLKAEVTHANQQRHGIDRRTRLFSNVHRLGQVGSATAPLSNWLQRLPGAGLLAERLFGIARERELPTFHRETFLDWMADREPALEPSAADREVLLLPDAVTNYHEPEIARAAVRVLEAADVAVTVPDRFVPVGRAAYSLGRLDVAADRARSAVTQLVPHVDAGRPIVTLEPSDAVMLQSDYQSLLEGPGVDRVAEGATELMEFLDAERIEVPIEPPSGSVTYHGHCHQKATNRAHHAASVLERHGVTVDELDSGCCGMAGSFGYEAEHYAMSRAIGRILFDQVDASPGARVLASGASCRTQLADHLGERATHPIELLDAAREA